MTAHPEAHAHRHSAHVQPVPTEEEAAAIAAALQAAWPQAGGEGVAEAVPRWRFSGRWWSKPLPARRDRP